MELVIVVNISKYQLQNWFIC